MYDGRHVVGRRHRLDPANKLQQWQRMLGNAVVRPRRELKLPNFALVQVVTLNTRGASVHISSYMGHGAKTITLSGAKAVVLSRGKGPRVVKGQKPSSSKGLCAVRAKTLVLYIFSLSCVSYSYYAPATIHLSVCLSHGTAALGTQLP